MFYLFATPLGIGSGFLNNYGMTLSWIRGIFFSFYLITFIVTLISPLLGAFEFTWLDILFLWPLPVSTLRSTARFLDNLKYLHMMAQHLKRLEVDVSLLGSIFSLLISNLSIFYVNLFNGREGMGIILFLYFFPLKYYFLFIVNFILLPP